MGTEDNSPQVLVVDDDASLCHLITLELGRIGIDVTCTDSSIDAIMKLRTGHFKVVLLDIMLKGSSGLYVVDALRDIPSYERPQVVIITGARATILTNIDRSIAKTVFFKPLEMKSLAVYVKAIMTNAA
jgi:DNA-binding response OmpR family regulator